MKQFRIIAAGFALGIAAAGSANAQAADWEGFYAGGSISSYKGEPNFAPDEASGMSLGVHGGYNFAVGPQFVVGGEVDLSFSSHEFDLSPGIEFGKDQSLRLRAGYATNQILVYGLVGTARATLSGLGTDLDATGTVMGLGGEYKFSPTLSGRLELTKTNYDSIDTAPPGTEIDANMITLGVSYHF